MSTRRRFLFGLAAALLAGAGALVWTLRHPSPGEVRRTVITTVQSEAPASFLVTGTLQITTEVEVDSSVYLTPDWLTSTLQATQPRLLSMATGRTRATVRVPGRVSYGFDVRRLTPAMIDVRDGRRVRVRLPPLSVHSVEPDLSRLEVQMAAEGWMQLFPSDAHGDVRKAALSAVEDAFRQQAEAHLTQGTQARVHTAEALAHMLRPALQAAGVSPEAFEVRISDRLVYTPPDSIGDAPEALPNPPPGSAPPER